MCKELKKVVFTISLLVLTFLYFPSLHLLQFRFTIPLTERSMTSSLSAFLPAFPVRSSFSTLSHPLRFQSARVQSARQPTRHCIAMSPLGWFQKAVSTTKGAISPPEKHAVLESPIAPPPDGWKPPLETATFALGW